MSRSLSGLSLRDLEYVAAVARFLHFGRAAEACGVSQPALSTQVRKLERYLGFELFERLPSGTRMTELGAEFAGRAAELVTAARDLLAASAGTDAKAGPFRLGAIPTLGPYLLPYAIRPIRSSLPDLRLLFTEGRTAELMLMLREGQLDAVLVCTPPADPALDHHHLFTEPLLLMHPLDACPEWPPAPGELLTLADGHCLRDQVTAACGIPFAASDRHAPDGRGRRGRVVRSGAGRHAPGRGGGPGRLQPAGSRADHAGRAAGDAARPSAPGHDRGVGGGVSRARPAAGAAPGLRGPGRRRSLVDAGASA